VKKSVSTHITIDGRPDITVTLRQGKVEGDPYDPIAIIQGDPDDIATILHFTLEEWDQIRVALDCMLRKEWPA
jgi:hypothetical protein